MLGRSHRQDLASRILHKITRQVVHSSDYSSSSQSMFTEKRFKAQLTNSSGTFVGKQIGELKVDLTAMVPATYRPLLWDSGCAVAKSVVKFFENTTVVDN